MLEEVEAELLVQSLDSIHDSNRMNGKECERKENGRRTVMRVDCE